MSDGYCWTIPQACEQFGQTGMPMDPDVLAAIIRKLRKQSGGRHWTPVGETSSGEHGGRGYALYEIGQLQRLHAALSPWLVPS